MSDNIVYYYLNTGQKLICSHCQNDVFVPFRLQIPVLNTHKGVYHCNTYTCKVCDHIEHFNYSLKSK